MNGLVNGPLNHLLNPQPLNGIESACLSDRLSDPGNGLVNLNGLVNGKGCSLGCPRVLERHDESPGTINHAIQGPALQGRPRNRLVNGTGNGLPNRPLNRLVNAALAAQPLSRAMNGIGSGHMNDPRNRVPRGRRRKTRACPVS